MIPNSHDFQIIIHQFSFFLLKEQVFLLSPMAFYLISKTGSPFRIKIPTNISLIEEKVIFCFELLLSLFETNSQIQIFFKDIEYFLFLSKVLENSFLEETCKNVTPDNSQFFYFSSKCFSLYADISFLNNFVIKIDDKEFHCNRNFLCCISDLIFEMTLLNSDVEIFEIILNPNDISDFMNIFQGNPFIMSEYNLKTIFEISNQLKCSLLYEQLDHFISEVNTLKDSVAFLKQSFCRFFPSRYRNSVQYVAVNFFLLSYQDFFEFSVQTIQQILISDFLKLHDENSLFEFILQLIQQDLSNLFLAQYVCFSVIDANLLQDFFDLLTIQNISFEIFENLKKSIILTHSSLPQNRWLKPQLIFNQADQQEIQRAFSFISVDSSKAIESFDSFFQNYTLLKNELEKSRHKVKLCKERFHSIIEQKDEELELAEKKNQELLIENLNLKNLIDIPQIQRQQHKLVEQPEINHSSLVLSLTLIPIILLLIFYIIYLKMLK